MTIYPILTLLYSKQFLYFCPSSWLYLLPCFALEFVFIFEERSISTLHLRPFFARNELGVSVLVSKFFNVFTPWYLQLNLYLYFKSVPAPPPHLDRSLPNLMPPICTPQDMSWQLMKYNFGIRVWVKRRKKEHHTRQKREYTPEKWRKSTRKIRKINMIE